METRSLRRAPSTSTKTRITERQQMLDALNPFPTLHPLIVHLPIVLIPLTPLLLLVAWMRRSQTLQWTATTLLGIGWIASLLASQVFHPHTGNMPLMAQEALRLHELGANWTQGLAGAGLLVLLLHNIFIIPKERAFLKIFAILLSLLAAGAVSLTGHYGAVLTHVYKVTVESH